jgi:hypothetical protein
VPTVGAILQVELTISASEFKTGDFSKALFVEHVILVGI